MQRFILLLIILVNFQFLYAGKEVFSNRRFGADIAVNSAFTTVDDKYFEMSSNPTGYGSVFTNHKVSNRVEVGLNKRVIQTNNFSGSVKLKITYDRWNQLTSSFIQEVEIRSFSVQHLLDGYAQNVDRSSFVFANAHRVKVQILELSNVVASAIYVETSIEVERYYAYQQSTVANLTATPYPLNSSFSSFDNEFIDISWDFFKGAESYELEYVHINDYTLTANVYKTIDEIDFNYYLNSTRVEVVNNYYRIPNIYDHGYFLFRVRPIFRGGIDYKDKITYDYLWSAPEHGSLAYNHSWNHAIFIGREYNKNLNWGHSVAFAEEGKRFESVSYVDGLGRARQSVVRNPITNQLLVNNVYYDQLGRGVISDLVTPVENSFPRHLPNFNRSSYNGESFSYENFDLGNFTGPCNIDRYGMSNDFGTSRYYSSNNPNFSGANGVIADAQDFPFSRMSYMDDFTGRVSKIAAAGNELNLGKNHETSFIYLTANQTELDQLFGEEVGMQPHYQKIIVIDGNGQTSVMYTDMAGRKIASYMIGPSPTNLDELEDTEPEILTTTLITNGGAQVADYSTYVAIHSSVQYFAEDMENYEFSYSFTPQQYQSICSYSSICFDCVYDLELIIEDVCGARIHHSSIQLFGDNLDDQCNQPLTYSNTFNLNIPKGEYNIVKRLKIAQSVVDDYFCFFIKDVAQECLPSLHSIFNQFYVGETFEECLDDEVVADLEQDGRFNCASKRLAMIDDISPQGQYGRYTFDNGVYSCTDPTSIFYGNTPKYTAFNYGTITVFDPLTSSLVSPSQLTLENYVLLYDESWASFLIDNEPSAHPESCMYEGLCTNNPAIDEYVNGMDATYTFYEALSYDVVTNTGGYFRPISFTSAPNYGSAYAYFDPNWFTVDSHLDPLFMVGAIGSNYRSQMDSRMQNYMTISDGPCTLSIWEYALFRAALADSPADAVGASYSCNFIKSMLLKYEKVDKCIQDLVWVYYREAYLNLRYYYFLKAQNDYALNNCPNVPVIGVGQGVYGDKWPHFPTQAFVTAHLQNVTANFGGANIDFLDPSNPNDVANVVNNMLTEGCELSCDRFADEWLDKLAGCNIQQTHRQLLFESFKALCLNGCDTEHPGGASTPNPNQQYVDANTGITNPTIKNILNYYGYSESMLCSELLIDQPLGYEYSLNLRNNLTTALDPCACDKILRAHNEFPTSGYASEELLFEAQTGIKLDDINHLVCDCEQAAGGQWTEHFSWPNSAINFLSNTYKEVPVELACPSADFCADCDKVTQQLDILLNQFGFTSYSTRLENFLAFNDFSSATSILKNFLNQALSFSKEYRDYSNFIQGCLATAEDPYCAKDPDFLELENMLKLMAFRGQVKDAQTIDLLNDNVVYRYSNLYAQGRLGNMVTTSLSNGYLSLSFQGATNCSLSLTVLEGQPFDFKDILSIESFSPMSSECSDNKFFLVEVKYMSCGVVQTGFLEGSSDCFMINLCACGDNGQLLCNTPPANPINTCYVDRLEQFYISSTETYLNGIDALYQNFKLEYNTKCSQSFATENYSYEGAARNYQYTLYYYDQAGNLIKTIAPKGVNRLYNQTTALASNRSAVTGPNQGSVPSIRPAHTFETKYVYNSYNQLTETTNPDQEGKTLFFYDRYGRMVASQNPIQQALNSYAYLLFDAVGRTIESGITKPGSAISDAILLADDKGATFAQWATSGTCTEVTKIAYDRAIGSNVEALFATGRQQNLRLRVASVLYYEVLNGSDYTSAVHYSYDAHGNVVEQIQDVPALRPVLQDIKSTQYDFELLSGNVNEVTYQANKADELVHKYEYDELNRLKRAYTSNDRKVHWDRHATYHYFDYGPLARVEYGSNHVQGQDFAYTINGWLKGMNASVLNPSKDIGKDGTQGYLSSTSQIHSRFAKDVTAYTLGYFEGDYRPINNQSFEISTLGSSFVEEGRSLYNGNISHLVSSISSTGTLGKTFRYDQMNRLKEMKAFYYDNNSQFSWSNIAATADYYNSYSYDKNGNLRTLKRNGVQDIHLEMDDFEYFYQESLNGGRNNRLSGLKDHAGASMYDGADIDNTITSTNYKYDLIGQLLRDEADGIEHIDWYVGSKKIKRIKRSDNNSPELEFKYNPLGQRVLKITKPRVNGVIVTQNQWVYTYYSYEAGGNVSAVYNVSLGGQTAKATLTEQHIYGAGRLGMIQQDRSLYANGTLQPLDDTLYVKHIEGRMYYELTNYLGNVEAVVNDRKMWSGSDYEAVVINYADYYPFGMLMPKRHHSETSYRYAYNGMEQDPEVKGDGNSYTTEFRQYDPRVGRWLSPDPMMSSFPFKSPYVAFGNNPVYYVDPLGLYDTKREARQARRGANDAGYSTGEIYGKKGSYVFNATKGDDYLTFSKKMLPIKAGEYKGGIEFYDAADAKGGIPNAQAHLGERAKIGMYTVVPYYVDNKLDHYVASCEVKDPSDLSKTTVRYDYVIGRDKLSEFEKNVETYEFASATSFGYGSKLHLEQWQIDLANRNSVGGLLGYLGAQWTDPVKIIFGAAGTIQGLSIPQAVQRNLQKMRMPKNARNNVVVSRNGLGQYKFEATSPGEVPGSKAVYTKIVDNMGNTLDTYKITYDHKGKFVHNKNKMK